MISVKAIKEDGIVIVEPSGKLQETDFGKLEKEIDAFSDGKAILKGLIINTKLFPGWDDFGAFLQHMKFLKDHLKQLQSVAIVTDSKLGEIGPNVAKHFVSATIKYFSYGSLDEAKQWIKKKVQ